MGLSGTKAGVLGSAFMFGFVFSSPLFAHYAFSVYPMVLMALGLFIWSLATAAAGLAVGYWMLLIARACTGIGEASFVCLVPPYILEIAPPSRKTVIATQLWIAMFYATIILGFACGSVYGEEAMSIFGSWRAPFLIESVVMLPFIALAAFFEKDPCLLPRAEGQEHPSLAAQLRTLARNRVFVFVVLGSAVITFTIGGLGFWGNSILETLFDVSAQTASLTFGSLTLSCGLLAVLIGSLLMDLALLQFEQAFTEGSITEAEFESTRTKVACLFAICSTTGAAALGVGCVFAQRFWLFIGLMGGAEFMIFLCAPDSSVGPMGVAIMSCVQKYLRGQANAVCVFFMHMLGDMPSPFIIGVMKDAVGLEWGIFVLSIWMLLGSVTWFFGYHYGGSLAKKQLEDPEAKKLIAGQ